MKKLITICWVLTIVSCANEPTNEEKANAAKEKVINTMKVAKDSNIDISALHLEKDDPYCGMPVTAGIVDTVTVKSKLYGFCSKECKEEFLKEQMAKNNIR